MTPIPFTPFRNCKVCDKWSFFQWLYPETFRLEEVQVRIHMIETHHSFNYDIPQGIEPVIQ